MVFVNFERMQRLLVFIVVGIFCAMWTLGLLPVASNFAVFVLLVISSFSQILLSFYGMNSYYLIYRAIVCPWLDGPQPVEDDRAEVAQLWGERPWPKVAVQLPIYNERFVIERLLRACVELEYPVNKLEIQVLDDSTDGTTAVVAQVIKQLSKTTRVKIVHMCRRSRTNFKAGALAQGTSKSDAEFFAIFDADFMPHRTFLKDAIPRFARSNVGCVQCRWGHLNDDHSWFTQLQAMGHDGHFVVEQYGKWASGFTFNFNGTAGVWRRKCIQEAGDWGGDTLAEDLDLSYRAQLKGWKIDYLRDVVVKAEVPLSISAFKKQQARWAKGSMQTALKLVRDVWDSTILTNTQKVQSTIHLFGYGVHLMMFFNLFTTVCLFLLTTSNEANYTLYLVVGVAIGPPLIVIVSQLWLGNPRRILLVPLLLLLHHGLCLSNTSAILEAFRGTTGSFERTPKFGDLQDTTWASTRYAQALRELGLPFAEIAMVLFLGGVLYSGLYNEVNVFSIPWILFFMLGFCYIIYLHVVEVQQMKAAVQRAKSAQAAAKSQ